jgi:hypothetical protein
MGKRDGVLLTGLRRKVATKLASDGNDGVGKPATPPVGIRSGVSKTEAPRSARASNPTPPPPMKTSKSLKTTSSLALALACALA